MHIQFYTTTFAEKTVLFPLNGLGNIVEIFDFCICKNYIYFWVLYSISLVYMSIFSPVPHYFGFCSFVISFEIKMCETSYFVFFQDYFDHSVSHIFHVNFRMGFSISAKTPLGFSYGLH